MDSGVPTIISQFKKTQSGVTVRNYYPEYPSFTAGGQVKFKDPWLIDYADPDFNDETRNRGKDAVFVDHNSPFTPGFSAINGKLYNGLFLNENENFLPNLNNYSVSHNDSPTTESFGGFLGNRQVAFYEWTGVNANFEDSEEEETAVVFTSSTAEARANLKISRVSNTSGTFKPYQRKVVRSLDGWEHMVYESMGHVWYEAKAPGGDWEIITRSSQRLYLDETDGKSPSITFNTYPHPWTYMTLVAWQDGTNIWFQVFFNNGNGEYNTGTFGFFSHGQTSSYNTQPNVV